MPDPAATSPPPATAVLLLPINAPARAVVVLADSAAELAPASAFGTALGAVAATATASDGAVLADSAADLAPASAAASALGTALGPVAAPASDTASDAATPPLASPSPQSLPSPARFSPAKTARLQLPSLQGTFAARPAPAAPRLPLDAAVRASLAGEGTDCGEGTDGGEGEAREGVAVRAFPRWYALPAWAAVAVYPLEGDPRAATPLPRALAARELRARAVLRDGQQVLLPAETGGSARYRCVCRGRGPPPPPSDAPEVADDAVRRLFARVDEGTRVAVLARAPPPPPPPQDLAAELATFALVR
jgi:hypothetical protein